MADRKRKLEDEDLNLEKSLKRRKSYSVELKLQIVSEAKISSYSEIARRYKIDENLESVLFEGVVHIPFIWKQIHSYHSSKKNFTIMSTCIFSFFLLLHK